MNAALQACGLTAAQVQALCQKHATVRTERPEELNAVVSAKRGGRRNYVHRRRAAGLRWDGKPYLSKKRPELKGYIGAEYHRRYMQIRRREQPKPLSRIPIDP